MLTCRSEITSSSGRSIVRDCGGTLFEIRLILKFNRIGLIGYVALDVDMSSRVSNS